ncbi:hypothetical protein MGALJ_15700 [Mycobacterium gallinarum]|uniref:Uncharacterized protein n=1 Tax=Mycobacterium gallinarum TaxID=39689 RepID=A0A9W4FEF6_9MYCO|nr:hypothetical protein MGALJ_15700 [Mycobacterium gallinarum]
MLWASEVAQLPHPEIGEHYIVGQRVDHEFGGRARTQGLPACGQRSQTGSAIDRPTEVVAIAQLHLTGVQRHPDAHGFSQHPGFVADRLLQLDGGSGRARRPIENRERRVALAPRLDQAASP